MSNYYRGMPNQEYWMQRSLEVADEQWKDAKKVEKVMAKHYRTAHKDIKTMVNDFYTNYATEHGMTYNTAVQQLQGFELEDYASMMKTYKRQAISSGNPFAIAEMERLTAKATVNRLEALTNQIDGRLLELGYTEQLTMEKFLSGAYEQTAYSTAFNIAKGTGVGVSFTKMNEQAIMKAITMPWSGDMFSHRIWDNRTKLVTSLRQEITQGLVKGTSVQKMSRNLSATMDSKYSNSLRLIRTETSHVMSEATAETYEKVAVQSYIYLATLDNRTSNKCGNLDGNVYKLSDKQVGINFPPLHPNCRSTIIPHFDDEYESLRISRLEDGSREYVSSKMNYKEWKEKYLI